MNKITRKLWSILFAVCLFLPVHLQAQNQEEVEAILTHINADSLLRTVTDLQNFGSRFALRDGGNREVAEYLVQRLGDYGVTAVIDSFYLSDHNWIAGDYAQWFFNVKGIFPSDNPKDDSLVLVGAHLDAIALTPDYMLLNVAPGADDNASGVAVMIELARICHEQNLHFKRNIHFMAYDGEELGLLGSEYDSGVRHNVGEKIAVMLNNDMVSYQPDENWRLTLHWYDNALDVVNLAADLCARYTNIQPVIPTAEGNGDSRYSDSYAYYLDGFRAVFAIEHTFSTSYHTDHDVSDSNNYDYHADVARYNMAMLLAFAEMDETVDVREVQAETWARLFPNPASETVTLQYRYDVPTTVSIVVTDMMGRVVLHQKEMDVSAGIHHVALNVSELPAGLYLCQLRTPQGTQTVKFIRK